MDARSVKPLLFSGIAVLAMVCVGFGLYIANHSIVILIISACATAGWCLAVGLRLVGRGNPADQPMPGVPGGERKVGGSSADIALADNQTPASRPTGSSVHRWIGGASMPGSMGRVNATVPMAVLELTTSTLTLRLRPRVLQSIFGAEPLVVTPNDAISVGPGRGRIGGRGIAVILSSGPEYYFWTSESQDVLASIAEVGFLVTREEHQVQYGRAR